MDEALIRTRMLLGEQAMEKLKSAHVAVFGLGGVGSYTAECLARSGVGELTLIDSDSVSESNINRQSIALHSTVGREKAVVMAERIRDINAACVLHPIVGTYTAAERERFWGSYDYVADCIDLVSCKIDLILSARERNIPILSALGTGNKLDASLLQITDISKTLGCPLARVMRKELRARGVQHLKVVYSPEEAAETEQGETPPPGRHSVPASAPWVPPVAGFLMAGEIAKDLIKE